jgi:hypothetical protein
MDRDTPSQEGAMATREQVEELVTKMREQRETVLSAVGQLSPDDLLRVPVDAEGEEQWTALEQLAHLAEMESSYDAWVRAALAEDNPDLSKVVPPRVAIPIEEANGHAPEEMLHQLSVLRAYTHGLIDGLHLDDFDRTATSPIFGTLTVLQWLRSFYRHDRQHGAQILGRKSDYQPNFVAGKEPNQRRMRIELVERRKRTAGQQ